VEQGHESHGDVARSGRYELLGWAVGVRLCSWGLCLGHVDAEEISASQRQVEKVMGGLVGSVIVMGLSKWHGIAYIRSLVLYYKSFELRLIHFYIERMSCALH
jgi:hypothetical protein